MTTVNFDLVAAGFDPTDGALTCNYVNEFEVGDVTVTTRPFGIDIVDGVGSVDLYPTPGNALRVRVEFGEQPRGFRSRFVTIPDSATPIEFTDLVEVDPDTFAAPELADVIDSRFDEVEADIAEEGDRAAAAEVGLDARLAAEEGASATHGDIVTHDADEFATDAEVTALVAAELADYQPGLEIGYAERATSATSVQTAANASGVISNLSIGPIIGAGRPVDVDFGASLSWNSVANKQVFASLMVNGVPTGAAAAESSPATSTGPRLAFNERVVLADGVSYTFTVALYSEGGGGTATAFANSTYRMKLKATNR